MNQIPAIAPLHGYKIIDLTRVLAGPLCTQVLGDYGADVVKIEPPSGDQSRTSGPPYCDDSSAMYYGLNRNKRSAVLDLKQAEQRQMLKGLLPDATVLIHNFKPGTMEKWGLGYEHLKQEFPKLIMASISGFGADGPLGGTPGYDGSAGAWAGVIASNGSEAGPMRVGLSVVDVSAGLHAAIGLLLAIKAMERDGVGQHLDISLYDCGLALLHPHGSNWLHGNSTTPRSGNQHPTFTPMGIYETADKPIYLAISTSLNFRKFCAIMGLQEVASSEKYATPEARLANRGELIKIVTRALKAESAEIIVEKLNQADIPAGVVLGADEALEHPHAFHRNMNVQLDGQRFVGLPIKLSRTPGGIFRTPPDKNQHFDEIFAQHS